MMPPLSKNANQPVAQPVSKPFQPPAKAYVQPTKPYVQPAKPTAPPPARPASKPGSRLESIAYCILLAAVVLTPLAFWANQYVSLETVKAFVVSVGVLAAAVLYGITALKERKLVLPPRSMVWLGSLMVASLIVSAFISGHAWKSIFGQGFEMTTASSLALLLLSSAVIAAAIYRRVGRAIVLYAAIVAPFLLLWIFHALRLIFGSSALSLGILSVPTATVFGNWFSLGIYAVVVAILGLSALMFLPLSRRMKIAYSAIVIASALLVFIMRSAPIWDMAFLTLLGLTIYATAIRPRASHDPAGSLSGSWFPAFIKRLSWIPLLACILAGIMAWQGPAIAGPVIDKMGMNFQELTLPWQMTLDVGTTAVKSQPLFGVGPGRFGQAFLANKPAGINQGDAWSAEFNSGFGLIPTLAAEEGLVGAVLCTLFFIFLGILGTRALKRAAASSDPQARFVVVSSFAASVFVWLVSFVYMPTRAAFFLAFVLMGIMLGASAAYGYLSPLSIPAAGRASRALPIVAIVLSVIAVVWGIIFIKDTVALGYFGKGIRLLTASSDPAGADNAFRMAVTLNPVDVYYEGRTEATLALAQASIAAIPKNADASTTQAAVARTLALGNQALAYSKQAIAADPTNYYNYVSMAHVAEFATNIRMPGGLDMGTNAYKAAIQFNPGNPALYLSLARLQASQNQLDAALQTVGATLQVKNNYLDAVFLLSQVEAAKGNLPDAITAAKFAIGLNSSSPLLYFQLGLLQYTAGDYAGAADTLAKAVSLQSNYANAQYFLGLAYARLNRMADAAAQFEQLAASNPDNQEVASILANLRAGKSPFAGATPAPTAPEKRPTPPISTKKP